jgi:hypothetical protein
VLRRCRPSADHFSGIRFDRHCDLIAEMIENKRRKKALGHIPVRQHSLDSTWGCSARAPNFAGLCHRLFERHDDFVSPLDGGNQVEYARGALRRKIGLSVMVRSPVASSRHSWKGRLAPSIAQRMAPAVICTQAWGHPAAAAPGRPRLVVRQPIWSPNGATQQYVRNRGRSGSARPALETTLMTLNRPRRGLSISPGSNS